MPRPRRHSASPRGGSPQNVVKRGSTPGQRSSDKRVRQKANAEEDGRRKAAREETARERERLERRIAFEAAHPTKGRVTGAVWAERQRELAEAAQAELEAAQAASGRKRKPARRPKVHLPPPDAQGTEWTMGQARSLLRAGYHIYHVQKVTGWGAHCFDDMKVDPDGYGLPIE